MKLWNTRTIICRALKKDIIPNVYNKSVLYEKEKNNDTKREK